MARRSDHSREEIREMALNAARQIVATEGPTGLSARKVAKAIGYTVGTLYLVFKNQEELILHLNGQTLDELSAALAAAAAESPIGEARLVALGRSYIRFAAEHHHRWALLFEQRGDEPLPEWYAARVEGLFERVRGALAEWAPDRDGAEIAEAAQALWCAVHGVTTLGLSGKLAVAGEVSMEALAERQMRCFLAGWRSR